MRRNPRSKLGLAALLVFAAGCGTHYEASAPLPTATVPITATATASAIATATQSPTRTPTAVPTSTLTATRTQQPTSTRTPTRTLSATPTSTAPPTLTATQTPGAAVRLDLDIRWSADVELHVSGNDVAAKLTLNDGREVAVAAMTFEGSGRLHVLPEADAVLYAAKFTSPPLAGGRCGAEPVSLSLTLVRRGSNDRVAGGIAAYCGADTYSGTPARVLRLSGSLPH
jgi:hypothetical protein